MINLIVPNKVFNLFKKKLNKEFNLMIKIMINKKNPF